MSSKDRVKVYFDEATLFFYLLCDDGEGIPWMSKKAYLALSKESREKLMQERWELVEKP